MSDSSYYWPVEFPTRDFPVVVSRRVNFSHENKDPRFALHWHEQLEFYYMLQGGMYLACDGEEQWIYPGDVGFVNWCDMHRSVLFQDNTVHYVFQVDLSLLTCNNDMFSEKYLNYFIVHSHRFQKFIVGDREISSLFDRVIDEYNHWTFGSDLIIKALFLNIIGLLLRRYFKGVESVAPGDASIQYTRKVLQYIAYHYSTCSNLDQVAGELGITKSYLCHTFKEHTGYTVIHYINRFRCYKAMSLIADGLPVTQAAAQVGFDDYNYFSRLFKKIIGFPPSQVTKKGDSMRNPAGTGLLATSE